MQPDSVPALFRLSELRLLYEGRQAVTQGVLDFLDTHAALLTREARLAIHEKLGELQSVFLTDDGQSDFFQGLAHARHADCARGLTFLSQAASLEKGNLRVLREKAQCERKLQAYDRAHATLKLAYQLDPFDAEVIDSLSDAYLFSGEYQKVLELFRSDAEPPHSRKQKTAQAIALYRSGATAPAMILLQALAEEPAGVAPIVFFALGKSMAERPGHAAEAQRFLERFVTLVSPAPDPALWDPYRTREALPEAQSLLAALAPPPSPRLENP
jgi:tetratricopeptide (TPR) repeat protein